MAKRKLAVSNSSSYRKGLMAFAAAVISVLLAVSSNVQGIDAHPPMNPALVVVPSPVMMEAGGRRVPKQVGMVGGAIINGNKDQQQAAGGWGHHDHHGFTGGSGGGGGGGGGSGGMGGMMGMGAGHGDSKYFMYAHNPHPDEYEFGYRRGNDYHFQERYEKYGPAWNFKTKVKWGDKKAGYGEHYWDYNHAGHDHGHDGGGGGGGGGGGDGSGSSSDAVLSYEQAASNKRASILAKRENRNRQKSESKRITGGPSAILMNNNVDHRNRFEDSQASPSRYAPRTSQYYGDGENNLSQIPRPSSSSASLTLDAQSGQVIDEATGRAYWLKPAAAAAVPY